ncbi:MAG: bifunctional diaminohydroxyphosphoribosylaminopyrimidine deaminase/5-amino-6-(5-phosphoribosylamino)uracil reductase RibD [Geminicoccaceae bacterium]|nr:bifunctional diaminohydroxyphosphoribosylaminopyrimidine deaminase/5-amino-6-(5-phosphoribosylamino)uracil reductase RibD [Geminicoccaceae bacterium]MDW8123220.1 bifunctional diaminohydroxyphosphoribosylaminopyrimidine deaminase/5-amino-6-(5-phosphoribosylamino)uracil reductase RibD [Geminicoccaceae bacterium]MDW8340120.1 bifunctional diaminohydroxyphosphoribosylaminopyrimidine deaminase/5-amino-6-(5-phosphoribosylamino)uracil reductase RibD [Geminicoccaceae bacterium]
MSPADERFMRLALALGARALGASWPNPAVGCVIVRDERIVGRGWTGPGGRPHAEAVALARAGAAARGATAYVTLEPCAHHGQTPPCCEALVAAGIARVVVAMLDPDPRVDGRGVAALRAAGVAVEVGCLEREAQRAHAGFASRIRLGRPSVTLKLATSLDGRIAAASGASRWITGPRARARAHLLRAEHDAVIVGSGTALVDDPELTCRLPGMGDRQPVRIVFDRRLRLGPDSRLARTTALGPVWLLTRTDAEDARAAALRARGVVVLELSADEESWLERALALLAERGITRTLVEGGGRLAAALLRAGLVDRLALFQAPIVIGSDGLDWAGALGLASPERAARWTVREEARLGEDRYLLLEPVARSAERAGEGTSCSPGS